MPLTIELVIVVIATVRLNIIRLKRLILHVIYNVRTVVVLHVIRHNAPRTARDRKCRASHDMAGKSRSKLLRIIACNKVRANCDIIKCTYL